MFRTVKKLGQGSFGEVFHVKAVYSNLSSREIEHCTEYAVKKSLHPFFNESDRHRKFQEVERHEMLPPHPNCVRYIQSWEENGYLYIQQELCARTLEKEMETVYNNTCIPENRVWDYLIDIASGLDHLHTFRFMHLDIKPENIFMGFDGRLKIGDFGLVCIEGKETKEENRGGDSRYMAQEILDEKFTCKADIFSLGVVILEISTGMDPPKYGSLWHRLRDGGGIPIELSSHISAELHRIIVMMLQDYENRPTARELLKMPSLMSRSRQELNYSSSMTDLRKENYFKTVQYRAKLMDFAKKLYEISNACLAQVIILLINFLLFFLPDGITFEKPQALTLSPGDRKNRKKLNYSSRLSSANSSRNNSFCSDDDFIIKDESSLESCMDKKIQKCDSKVLKEYSPNLRVAEKPVTFKKQASLKTMVWSPPVQNRHRPRLAPRSAPANRKRVVTSPLCSGIKLSSTRAGTPPVHKYQSKLLFDTSSEKSFSESEDEIFVNPAAKARAQICAHSPIPKSGMMR